MLKWFKITSDKVKKFRAYLVLCLFCWTQRSNLGTRIYSIHLCSAFGITKKGMRTRIIVQRCQKIFPMQRLLFVEICHTYKHRHVVHNIIVVENIVMTFPKNEWDSIIWTTFFVLFFLSWYSYPLNIYRNLINLGKS